MNSDEEYRRHAAECQRMAANTRNDTDKGRWLRMAEDWMRMVRNKDASTATGNDFATAHSDRQTGQKDSDSSH